MNVEKSQWKLQDAATSTGTGAILYPNRCDSLTIETFGTASSSTLIFEAQGAGQSTWYAISGVNLADFSVASQTTSLGQLWSFDLTGVFAFRTRLSAVSGGNVSVYGKLVNSNG